ncbi:prepilin-type N-terminal cleavage/methylation domain-containing protein [Acidiphilium sp. PA]|uniref:prepilin-type N-terminal cleavage/methylation domain-containing protein n=1 Tax=Acidiphilium sp. PA TaxID=2871705 RepID=UPI002242F0FC|nr:prepilin-type N-terminal cleavage/methylation domain-containing protein [Acidiphilium sp. PA]MCW8306049.1 prepilin-type N-terminal cleavage/methylation domain-containing protein [Acidiphilium sp. PA]
MKTGHSRSQAGFTLLEIMVALVVFGFLMIGLAQSVSFGLRAWNGQARSIAARGDLDATDRVLRTLIGQMAPGFKVDPPNIIGRAHGLAFTTHLPEGAPVAAFTPVDVSLTVDARHDFILRWTPHFHAVRLAGAPVIRTTILLHGVASVDFAYWRPAPGGGAWVRSWDGRTPPALVECRLHFATRRHAADRRHWPMMVIAPMRQPVF